ncbi:MAG: hypothetical protein ACD_60C00048G0010 [uncultured bacterium]|nr:MAG: hypothetical protein ACD_60C00048G0010 [uncultured bacterium]
MKKIRFLIGVVLAGVVAEFIHTNVGMPATHYNTFIDLVAYLTKPLQALGAAIIYYLMGDRLPTQSRFLRGIILGLLILLVKGQLIREPLMNFLLPNTMTEVLLQSTQVWLSNFAMAIIITLMITPKNNSSAR